MKKKYDVKRIWVIIFAIMAIILLVGGTLAIYTSQVYQRAVVRNRDNEAVRFSSDKLLLVAPNTHASEVYYPVAESQNTLTFQVCNYDQSKSTLVSESDIGYTISFDIEGNDPDFNDYSVSCNGGIPEPLERSHHILPGGEASVDNYTVTFSVKDYRNLKLTVTVTPDKFHLTRNNILTATLIPIAYGTTQKFQVKLEFPDSLRKKENNNPFTPKDMDAYNVLVTATGGDGDVYIRWNPAMVEMDSFFRSRDIIKSIEQDEEYLKAVLHMNSADDTASYLIPFYNPNPTNPEWKDWNELAEYIQAGTVDTP